jgi:hypothetical protein
MLGVTGHRDLRPQDVAGLRDAVRGVLRGFRERYPSTRLVVLSSLAEGADRLVAYEALEIGLSQALSIDDHPDLVRDIVAEIVQRLCNEKEAGSEPSKV